MAGIARYRGRARRRRLRGGNANGIFLSGTPEVRIGPLCPSKSCGLHLDTLQAIVAVAVRSHLLAALAALAATGVGRYPTETAHPGGVKGVIPTSCGHG